MRRRDFYPRPHMEGDLLLPRPAPGHRNFYPRPHMEGDKLTEKNKKIIQISTHALTWRATQSLVVPNLKDAISTHALTWRATWSLTSPRITEE